MPEQRHEEDKRARIRRKLAEAYLREKGASLGEWGEAEGDRYRLRVNQRWCPMSADEFGHSGGAVHLTATLRAFLDTFLRG